MPIVLSHEEVAAVLEEMSGMPWLMCSLLYGAGLRLLECCRLRVKDVDFDRREFVFRQAKGDKDCRTMLPEGLVGPLREHLVCVREQHGKDLAAGTG